jgi:hypothetical protein
MRSWIETFEFNKIQAANQQYNTKTETGHMSLGVAASKSETPSLVSTGTEPNLMRSSSSSFDLELAHSTESLPNYSELQRRILKDIRDGGDIPMAVYIDPIMSKKNKEMHILLKSIPTSDYVIESFSASLQKDILAQGKLFVTQNRLCFHSNILGFINSVVLHLKDIKDITKKGGALQQTITILAFDQTVYNFKIYTKPERTFNVITALWKNALSETSLTAQELITLHSDVKPPLPKKNSSTNSRKELLKEGIIEKLISNDIEEESKPLKENAYKLPESIPVPTSRVQCGCSTHFEMVKDVILPVPAKQVFEVLFGSDSPKFWQELDKEVKITSRFI